MSEQQSLTPLKALLFAFHATNTIIISYLPLYLAERGLTGSEIGFVLAVGPLAQIISQPFWGYMSDKHKTVKRFLLICIFGLIIFSSIFLSVTQFYLLIFFGFLFYFFSTPIGALGDSLAQRRADDVGVSFGTIRTWGSVGFATSSLAIGLVLTIYGVEYMLWPYLAFALIALFVTFRVKDVKVEQEPVSFKDAASLLKYKPFIFFLFFMMFLTVSHRANDSYIGLYIAQLGGSNFYVGVAWFVGVISEAIVFFFAGRWFRKYPTLIFVILAGAIYTLRWFLFALVDDYWMIIGLQFLHGLTFGILYLSAMDYVTRLIPRILQSTGHLIFYAVFFGVSGIIGSLLGGAIIDQYGGSTLYFVLGFIALSGTILMTLYHLLPYGKKA